MKKLICFILVTVLLGTISVGCGSKDTKKEPSTKEASNNEASNKEAKEVEKATEFTIQTVLKEVEDPNGAEYYKELAEETGITINWKTTPEVGWSEKKPLILASGELPDAFLAPKILKDKEVILYGAQGTIIPLEDYITPENTPNIVHFMNQYPDYKSEITAPDGHIYSLAEFDDGFTTTTKFPLFINKDWLDVVGMDVPETTEDYYQVLKAFKEKDVNGNGDPSDEIPYTYEGVPGEFFGAFGVLVDPNNYIAVKDGKIVYSAMEEGYREGIQYLHKLYTEGLIDQEAFTQDGKGFKAKTKSDPAIAGSFHTWRSTSWAPTQNYVPVPPLEGPKGHRYFPRLINGIYSKGTFAITSACSDPKTLMAWVDKSFEPFTSFQNNTALKEGVHLEKQADGKYKQVIEATSENRKGLFSPARITAVTKEAANMLLEAPKHMQEKMSFDELYKDYYYPEYFPKVYFTIEELEKLSSLTTDLVSFTSEIYAQWIVNGGVEEWDKYIKNLEDMGVEDYIKIYQSALDRYNQTK